MSIMFSPSILCVFLLFGVGSLAYIDRVRLPDNRIVGGQNADIREHPYQLTFHHNDAHTCGASIISRKWAVTAGHCVVLNPRYSKLGAGSRHRYNSTFYNVVRVVRHPLYDAVSIDYDVALLEIEEEFPYGDTVQPVKLANHELKDGQEVNVTGWGATQQGGMSTNLLLRVTVPIVNRKVCKDAYVKVKPVTERMICAGLLKEGGKDSCQGDSGGPLTANGILYGIVSWGYGCARPNYPGVYTNVANLRPWITNITGI